MVIIRIETEPAEFPLGPFYNLWIEGDLAHHGDSIHPILDKIVDMRRMGRIVVFDSCPT
jgi:hypothetical protein